MQPLEDVASDTTAAGAPDVDAVSFMTASASTRARVDAFVAQVRAAVAHT